MNNQIEQYAKQLSQGSDSSSCDMRSSCVHLVQAPIPRELFDNLKSMADKYGKDARCIAGDVLSLAIQDVFDALPAGEFEKIVAARKRYDTAAAKKHMEEQFFNAGGS